MFTLPKMSISPSVGQLRGRFEAKSQKAGHDPRPDGILARISNTPYLNSRIVFNLDEV